MQVPSDLPSRDLCVTMEPYTLKGASEWGAQEVTRSAPELARYMHVTALNQAD